MTFFLDALTLL